MDQQALALALRGLCERVPGITGTAVAAANGLLLAADTGSDIDPEGLAALAAAALGLARRTTEATARGSLRGTVAHGTQGCAAFYAVGDTALLVVLGDEGVDVEALHRAARPAVDRIGSILAAEAPGEMRGDSAEYAR
ncbi:roadblock/LC7 domain-containing protein [Streptomyces sp. NPDC052040]|uniref:roadblock/LC7 domain-containing protein n=1 Tax=Streptomyces sp. NPDC052040 TaxID=3365682 RepID=UPI0037D00200